VTDTTAGQRSVLHDSAAFSGFSVSDPAAARAFYADVLGIPVRDADGGMFRLLHGDGHETLVYPSPGHRPGSFTVLNFPVADIEPAVAELAGRGVEFERYPGTPMETDEAGIFRKGGPLIAWFTDPAGNTLSLIQQP
jgi:catechol 2,3-dioxygenase-like lactoylglutathione lyase family enzyme